MKNFIKKIKNIKSNRGSSLVLVIVAIGFVGILAGALLTAVGYAYRLKLYDYNAKSNFHYLEQGMDEIYAGIGRKTLANLQEAYEETREEVIYFDTVKKSYETRPDDEANDLFKNKFMSKVSDATYFQILKPTDSGYSEDAYKKTVLYDIENMITNSSVKLDKSDIKLEFLYYDTVNKKVVSRNTLEPNNYKNLSKVILRNVRLTREAEYSRSVAKGTFKQSIQTDIEIARPDFEVSFGNLSADTTTLFGYCLIADSGVDIDWTANNVLTVNGNIYAANDFYNKDYNNYSGNFKDKDVKWTRGTDSSGKPIAVPYKMNKVSAYSIPDNGIHNLYNKGKSLVGTGSYTSYPYDGKNLNSKYSGFYLNGGNVNILADKMIVPGSISVMNGAKLSVYGINGSGVGSTDVWADEVILGGYSLPGLNNTKEGASALFNANLYIKDDAQLESEYSNFKLSGGYYGFSYSGESDNRSYTPIVAKDKTTDKANIYQTIVKDSNGNEVVENKGHYNSSSIIVNGQYSTLDLSETSTIFIAGRSYIELSSNKNSNSKKNSDESKVKNSVKESEDYTAPTYTEYTYEYDDTIQDYRTGESISSKSNQLAYYPNKAGGALNSEKTYFELSDGSALKSMNLIKKYFKDGKIPVKYSEVVINEDTSKEKKKEFFYIDFERLIVDKTYYVDSNNKNMLGLPDTINESDVSRYAEQVKQQFIKDYFDYFDFCVNKDSEKKLDYMGYEEDRDSSTYSSRNPIGALAFSTKYPDVDTFILEPHSIANVLTTSGQEELSKLRSTITDRVNELQNVTNYQDFVTGQIAVANVMKTKDTNGNIIDNAMTVNKAYTSGGITMSDNVIKNNITNLKNVTFNMRINNNSNINSNLLGETGKANTNKTNSMTGVTDFAKDYNKHYNYHKWALKDVNTDTDESRFLDTLIDTYGEGAITPINYYMNFDVLDQKINGSTVINPSTLDLGEYEVYASDGDIVLNAKNTNKEITGIVVTKGDIYIKDVKKFNGLIISGGKIYIDRADTSITSINSSILCKNVINECISRASDYNSTDANKKNQAANAVKFLKLFKAYEDIAKEAEGGKLEKNSSKKSITNIDYSDVIRYNNWMKNVD